MTHAPSFFGGLWRHAPRLRIFFLLLTIALCGTEAHASGSRPQQYNAGLRTIGVWRPELNARLDVAVWYPSSRAPFPFRLDGWTIIAARDGRIVPGKYPLILLSHNTASTRLADHDLAAELAKRGFIVVAPTHPGDNMDDTSFLYRGLLFRDRPRHLLLAMEEVLASPVLGPHADPERIGLLGSGSGSATVLQLAGATPDFSGMSAYCATAPGLDPYCTPWAGTHRETTVREMLDIAEAGGATAFTPMMTSFTPASAQKHDAPEAGQADPSPPPDADAVESGDRENVTAPRIVRSIAVVTPGLAPLFSPASLAAVQQPVAIVAAAKDDFFPVDGNADYLRRNLPRIPAFLTVSGAMHADLHAPCPQGLLPSLEPLCSETTPDNAVMRQERAAFIGQFFLQTLGGPLPPDDLPAHATP